MTRQRRLTPFQRTFVLAYLRLGNLTDAYLAVSQSSAKRSTLATNASRLFALPHVRNYYYRCIGTQDRQAKRIRELESLIRAIERENNQLAHRHRIMTAFDRINAKTLPITGR